MGQKPKVIPTKQDIENAKAPILDENGYNIADKAASDEMDRILEEQLAQRKTRETVQPKIITPKVEKPKEVVKVYPDKQINVPFDLIPLPSGGKIYNPRKPRLKVAYLNASDENILTAPHLIESGQFLDILLDRKILDNDINPKDLHVGDRNAIMIWLRATAYGTEYPIQVINPFTGELIETTIDLSTLKTKKLGAEPDEDGLFPFTFPSGATCRFKLLTVGDIEDLGEQDKYELEELNLMYANSSTHSLEKQIVEFNGETDPNIIKDAISVLLLRDSRAFRKYVAEIESGIDMTITIQVPGGEPFNTFLPVNTSFFWPEL